MEGRRSTGGTDVSSDAVLRVRLLGGFDIRDAAGSSIVLGSGRAESLLAYLLLHRGAPHTRERIAFALWPDSTEAQARTNLRHVLHTLRRALPGADRSIDAAGRALRWRDDAPVWLDVAAFEDALADGRLQDAVGAYGGDLLEGSYDEWLLQDRERLAQAYVEALDHVVRASEREGRPAEAIAYAEILLRRDPLREETYRTMMRLCDAAGDRARAVRVYHACDATLQRELGVAPSEATRAIYDALLPPASAPAGTGPSVSPFVGRAAERARLTAAWKQAEAAGARLVLITGEPGIGKSRIVEELRSWCTHRGAVSFEAHAYAAEGTMAFAPIAEWLRSEPVAGRLRRLEPAHLAELSRLLPELAPGSAQPADPEPLPEPELRRRIFDAAARAIGELGSSVLLVAEDVHWFDESTLRFLHYLLRTRPASRLLIAATARREELDPAHPLHDVCAGAQALERFEEIALERLGAAETSLLAERVGGRALPAGEAARLFGETEGNPLFVVEAIRSRDEGTGGAAGQRVRAVIAARLSRLSEPAARLAGIAAAIGREFTADLLKRVAATDDESFVRGLDELWRRGIVRARGPHAYDFSHEKVREAVSAGLSPVQASDHHLRIARTLEAADPSLASRIAAHYDAAGMTGDAIEWYDTSAHAAQRLHANGDAVQALERALVLAADLPAGADRDRLELGLITAMTAPLIAVDGYTSDRTVRLQQRALHLASDLGVEPDPPMVRSLAMASLTRADFDQAHLWGERLRSRAEHQGDDVLWVESAYVLGVAAYWPGRLAAARDHFQEAVQRYRPELRAQHLARYGQDAGIVCRLRLAHVQWLLGDADAAAATEAGGLADAERSGHPYTRDVAFFFATVAALDRADDEHVRALAASFLAGESVPEARQHRSSARAFEGYLRLSDGDGPGGVAAIREAYDQARREASAPGQVAFLGRLLVAACLRAGLPHESLEAADEWLAAGGAGLWESEVRRLRAAALRAQGRDGPAVAELERALAVARRQGARPFEQRIAEDLSRSGPGTA